MKNKKSLLMGFIVLLLTVSIVGCGGAQNSSGGGGGETDGLPSGYLEIQGSDTMVNLGQALAEAYMEDANENAILSVTGGGSGTGIAAMINNNVDIAQSSRAMKPEEIEMARNNGVTVYEFIIGQDGLAVMVNENNPIDNLTMAQLKDIFTGKITDWSELGWPEGGKMTIYSRQSNSGTYVFFNETVMDKEDWADGTMFMPGSAAIAEGITIDRSGIGYSGVGYVKEGIKAVNVALTEGGEYVTPMEKANVDSGKYPIARPLFFYTNGVPEDLALHYLKWVLSPDGQQVVSETGFYFITPEQRQKNDQVFRQAGIN